MNSKSRDRPEAFEASVTSLHLDARVPYFMAKPVDVRVRERYPSIKVDLVPEIWQESVTPDEEDTVLLDDIRTRIRIRRKKTTFLGWRAKWACLKRD